MIVFNGPLSGAAEKRFFQKGNNAVQNIFLAVVTLFFPAIAYFCVITDALQTIPAYCSLYVAIPLLARIPKSKKERLAMMPQKICIDRKQMVAITGHGKDIRLVDDVKKIIDHGDFYEICFRFGKDSLNFICQKSLLTKGTLEEFDELFGEKILGYQVS